MFSLPANTWFNSASEMRVISLKLSGLYLNIERAFFIYIQHWTLHAIVIFQGIDQKLKT